MWLDSKFPPKTAQIGWIHGFFGDIFRLHLFFCWLAAVFDNKSLLGRTFRQSIETPQRKYTTMWSISFVRDLPPRKPSSSVEELDPIPGGVVRPGTWVVSWTIWYCCHRWKRPNVDKFTRYFMKCVNSNQIERVFYLVQLCTVVSTNPASVPTSSRFGLQEELCRKEKLC